MEEVLFGRAHGDGRLELGLFDRAHRGTLFLDEIGDVKPAIQVKLLTLLQEH